MEFTPVGSSHVFAPAAAAGGGGGEAERACGEVVEKEHMFDKVVTPSDVGKLNRLVIPKQHAEKYFPLDAASNEKGLLLSFEDRTGKPWRFRYSYWNSSQSYVMTKGWSRFVKEKRLDAGDTVSFGRGVGEAARGRLFIDWRRRPDVTIPSPHHRLPLPSVPFAPWAIGGGGGGRLLLPPPSSSHHQHVVAPYDAHHYHHRRHGAAGYDGYSSAVGPTRQVLFLRPQQPTVVLDSVPVRITAHAEPAAAPSLSSPSGSKRVRLFGVNLECPSAGEVEGAMARMAPPPLQQLPSPPSSSSSSSGKARCSLNLDL